MGNEYIWMKSNLVTVIKITNYLYILLGGTAARKSGRTLCRGLMDEQLHRILEFLYTRISSPVEPTS